MNTLGGKSREIFNIKTGGTWWPCALIEEIETAVGTNRLCLVWSIVNGNNKRGPQNFHFYQKLSTCLVSTTLLLQSFVDTLHEELEHYNLSKIYTESKERSPICGGDNDR